MANLYIFDNFYQDVDSIRENALQMDFSVVGNYPGHRTSPVYNPIAREKIENLIRPFGGRITDWRLDPEAYNGSFQYTTCMDRSWIHVDSVFNWAGVVYLTPNAPLSSGTGIFRNKRLGIMEAPKLQNGERDEDLLYEIYGESGDMTKWDLVDRIGNVYNRLVLYRADLFHSSLDYFGNDKESGRLFQTFFFSSEY